MYSTVLVVVLAALGLAACSEPPFDQNTAIMKLQAKPIQLDGEQVVLTPQQVSCGEREDLWVIIPLGEHSSLGRMSDAGRALGFSDHLHIGEANAKGTYVQIRGTFKVKASSPRLRDVDEDTKLLEAKVGVVMDHSCLKNPDPQLMGFRHGQFSFDDNPAFRFLRRAENDWYLDQLVH